MEWVETTGKSIEDAKEAALDELGVDEQDAEFEVIDEPRLGLFGRLRSEGRVRARVRPVAAPSKDDRRRRARSGSKSSSDPGAKVSDARNDDASPDEGSRTTAASPGEAPPRSAPAASRRQEDRLQQAEAEVAQPPADAASGTDPGGRQQGPTPAPSTRSPSTERGGERNRSATSDRDPRRREGTEVEVSLEEQGRIAEEFLHGLVDEFGLAAEIAATRPDEDTLDLALSGEGLGLLIGPKGATLLAIQDLTRTVVQRRTGASHGRIHVDVGGYRQKRSEALRRFAHQVADEVKSSGARKALEPMSAPDRKVVHDALTDIEGVSTMSEGEDARRRVVILPSD